MPSYTSLVGFLLLGAALIAICMYISSLTKRKLVSFFIGMGVLALTYFGIVFLFLIPNTPVASLIAILILELVAGALLWAITRKLLFSIGFVGGAAATTAIIFFLSSDSFAGAFRKIAYFISPFVNFESPMTDP